MKKLINRKIAMAFDIAALVSIVGYIAIDNDVVDCVCLTIWGKALIVEIAYKISTSKRS